MENPNNDSEIFFQQGFGIGPFQMMQEIGKGRFGKVFLGIHEETKEKVAIKQIEKSDKNIDLNSIYAEINIHKKLFHPYICKMYYVIENFNYIFIVTEYCSKGEIFKILTEVEGRFEEAKACKIFTQILSALEYLHNNYIAHRDVKLENMLMDENGDAKLIDFGLSKSFEGDIDFNKSPGSPWYASPEVLLNQPYKGKIADIWSMGICLYAMVYGDYPFYAEEIGEFVREVIKKEIQFPDNINISPELKDLLKKLLEKNPKNRITMEQIKEHPWMHILDFNFMKSPGLRINEDIFPIDLNIIKEISGNNETKIRNIISDILMNKHNNNTILYYLKVENIIRNKGESISDIRPTSDLFLKYINKEQNKLDYYNNDINKKIDELTKYLLNEFLKEEFQIREDIKKSLNINKSNSDNNQNNIINNNLNKINTNDAVEPNLNDKNKLNKRLSKLRSKSFQFENFQEFLKKEGEKKETTKKNKLELINEYIGPLLFIHDIIDNIITNVIKLKNKEVKELFIPVNNSSLNVLAIKTANMKEMSNSNGSKSYNNSSNQKFNFSIDTIEEIEFTSSNKKNDKTFSFDLPKTKNKNIPNIKNQGEIKSNKNKKNDTISYREYKKLNSINLDNSINEFKNKKFERKKILSHLKRNKSENLSNILNNNFSKVLKNFKSKIEKSGILGKNNKKRSLSHKKTIKKINKLIDDEEIDKFIKNKKKNYSEKKSLKSLKLFQIFETKVKIDKKEKKKEIKSIKSFDDKKRILLSRRINRTSKNIDENLKINEILSENKRKNKNMNLNSSVVERNLTKINEKPPKTNRNFNLSQVNFYNRKMMNSTINNSERKKETLEKETLENSNIKKNKGRKYLIKRNKKKETNKENNNELNKTTKPNNDKRNTTPNKMIEKPKKKDIKSSIFVHKNIKTTFCKTGRNERNIILEESTNNSSLKNKDKNNQIETINTESNNLCKLFKKMGKKVNNNKESENKNEIKSKKNESIIRNIIIDNIGYNNMTISNLKDHIKFACKIYINKKKVKFNINLYQKEKNKNILIGEFIEGDDKNFEKLFSAIKEKLE